MFGLAAPLRFPGTAELETGRPVPPRRKPYRRKDQDTLPAVPHSSLGAAALACFGRWAFDRLGATVRTGRWMCSGPRQQGDPEGPGYGTEVKIGIGIGRDGVYKVRAGTEAS